MSSTTKKGDGFRDVVGQLLRAAGFSATEEMRVGHKHVDVVGVYSRDELTGSLRYAFEAKNYDKSLPVSECAKFVSDYQPLLHSQQIDHAWLISHGPISPAGMEAIEAADRRIQAFTFAEFQRRLLSLDSYMKRLVDDAEQIKLSEYYIPPETPDGNDLFVEVNKWIAEANSPPLFVLGPYGKGKSTFALHLASQMAKAALNDHLVRVPILIKLGEIADEQSIEGLLGKVLTSQYRVQNYHFETFQALNREGRFLIIYDGFDEMKHGLTHAKFQYVMTELMRLDEGNSRILVLGRDTAFHDEREFRSIIHGVQLTAAGTEVPMLDRRPYRTIEIRGFTSDEAKTYVQKYLPIRAARETTGSATDSKWVRDRILELTSGRFDQLLERPVHAQMLCEIAILSNQLRADMSVYELFDSFVHYLLEREVKKKGRNSQFPIAVRRTFNAGLAWWLWQLGGFSTTTLADIPQVICDDATADITHSLPKEEMRRELIQGCLVEKGSNTIYFHRSIQEFLVAEHLITQDLLQNSLAKSEWLSEVTKNITPEVIEFIVAGATATPERLNSTKQWISLLSNATGDRIPFGGFSLFNELARHISLTITDAQHSAWLIWLRFFTSSGADRFGQRRANTYNILSDLITNYGTYTAEVQAAVVYAVARVLQASKAIERNDIAFLIASLLPMQEFVAAVEAAREKRSNRLVISQDDSFFLWSILSSWNISRDESGALMITIDLVKLHHGTLHLIPGSFEPETGTPVSTVSLSVQALYQALSNLPKPVSDKEIDRIRPYFNDSRIQKHIVPVVVEYRTEIVTKKIAPPKKPVRETLSISASNQPTKRAPT